MADTYRKLTRPPSDASPIEVGIYRREMAAALSAVGIDFGEEYVVVKASEFNQQQSLDAAPAEADQSQLGPFVRDSETSRQAAIDNYPRKGGQRHTILTVFAAQIPMGNPEPDGSLVYLGYTRDELERITSLSGNAVRPRVKELLDGGYLEETEDTRPTRTGSEATVLQITSDGRRIFFPDDDHLRKDH